MTVERWDALRPREIEEELRRAHALIYEKLPKRTKTVLAMPEKERARLIRERKKVLAEREKAKKEREVRGTAARRANSDNSFWWRMSVDLPLSARSRAEAEDDDEVSCFGAFCWFSAGRWRWWLWCFIRWCGCCCCRFAWWVSRWTARWNW